jgi:hypothetical protein
MMIGLLAMHITDQFTLDGIAGFVDGGKSRALPRGFKKVGTSVGDFFLFENPVTLPESCQLHRSGISGLSKPIQGGVTSVGTFDYFAGDNPTSPVFLTAGRKKQTRPLKGDFHISHGSGVEVLGNHVILSSLPGQNIELKVHDRWSQKPQKAFRWQLPCRTPVNCTQTG